MVEMLLISRDHAIKCLWMLTIQAFIFDHSHDSFNNGLHIGGGCTANHSIERIVVGLIGKISLKIGGYSR